MSTPSVATAEAVGTPPFTRVDCPWWCVECWRDLDPGTRFHRGRAYVVNGADVSVERYDDESGPGEVRVSLVASPDVSLAPADARRLAALLLVAADEGDRR